MTKTKEATFYQDGMVIDVVLTADTTVGDIVVVGEWVGVAQNTGVIGDTITVAIDKVWDCPALDTDTGMSQGDTVYWDATNGYMTLTSTDNTLAGKAAYDIETDRVKVKLNA